jgi:putative intracellular protease/amidase
MTVPYYAFADAGMRVDIASIQGGPIPIEPASLRWPVASAADKHHLGDPALQSKVQRSLELGRVDGYDIVFLPAAGAPPTTSASRPRWARS